MTAGGVVGNSGENRVTTRATTSRVSATVISVLFSLKAVAHIPSSAADRLRRLEAVDDRESNSALNSATLSGRWLGCISKALNNALSVWGERFGLRLQGEGKEPGSRKRCLASVGGCPVRRW